MEQKDSFVTGLAWAFGKSFAEKLLVSVVFAAIPTLWYTAKMSSPGFAQNAMMCCAIVSAGVFIVLAYTNHKAVEVHNSMVEQMNTMNDHVKAVREGDTLLRQFAGNLRTELQLGQNLKHKELLEHLDLWGYINQYRIRREESNWQFTHPDYERNHFAKLMNDERNTVEGWIQDEYPDRPIAQIRKLMDAYYGEREAVAA